jgi:hypothetical protein
MKDYEENLYYAPQTWGLELVGEIEYSSGSYEFDTRIILKDADGKFFMARDSGCSCPTPFEDFESLSDLETPTIAFLMNEVSKEMESYSQTSLQEAQQVIDRLRELGLR